MRGFNSQTTDSENATTGVAFVASKPIVDSFTSTCYVKGKPYGNSVCFDASAYAYSYTNTLNWSVQGAVRYTISTKDVLIYSGSGSVFNLGITTYRGNYFVLTAYSTNSTDSPFTTFVIEPKEINTDPGSQNG